MARAGLRADRSGRPVHRRRRLRDLRRRRVAGQVALQLLHRRADAEHRAPAVREAGRRELHDREGSGPRADRVHAQPRPLVPARSRRASVPTARSTSSTSTTRPSSTTTRAARSTARPTPPSGPTATTTSAASGACSTSRRRSSTCRRSNRTRSRRADPRDGDEPERARQADRLAARAGEPRRRTRGWRKIKKPMGSSALALYERARGATTAAERKAVLDTLREGDRQLDAVGDRRGGDRAGADLRRERARLRASAGADRFRRRRPARRRAGQCRAAARLGRGRRRLEASAAQGDGRPRRSPGWTAARSHGRGDDRGAAEAARRSGDDGGGAADRREVGQGGRVQRQRRARGRALARRARRRDDERRPPRRARREPARRAGSVAPRRSPRSRRCSPTRACRTR